MVRLTAEDHARVTAAVSAAEAGTDGEIVTVVAASSDRYHDVALHWALLATLFLLAGLATWPAPLDAVLDVALGGWGRPHGLRAQLTALTLLLVAAFLLARLLLAWWPLRIALTPGATRTRRVRRRALELFRVGAEGRTRAKTAVLLYLSLAEHRAELVADEAIAGPVVPETWGEAMAALVEAVKDGRPGDGMAAAVAQVGAVLAEHFPRSADDRDELPDRLVEL